MQSYNKTVKNKTVPVFIAICGLAIAGSVIFGTRASHSVNVDNNQGVTQSHKEILEIDKPQINKKLNTLQYAVSYALDGERTISEGIGNVLKFDSEKIKFAFMMVSEEGNNSKVKRNISPDGNGVTGYFAVDKGYFIDYYQDLFYTGVNEELLADLFVEKDGYIYGSVMNGVLMSTETYKVNSVTKENDDYEVIIDVLVINYDDESEVKYMSEEVTEYPLDAVAYQIKLNVTKTENGYTINSMVA